MTPPQVTFAELEWCRTPGGVPHSPTSSLSFAARHGLGSARGGCGRCARERLLQTGWRIWRQAAIHEGLSAFFGFAPNTHASCWCRSTSRARLPSTTDKRLRSVGSSLRCNSRALSHPLNLLSPAIFPSGTVDVQSVGWV